MCQFHPYQLRLHSHKALCHNNTWPHCIGPETNSPFIILWNDIQWFNCHCCFKMEIPRMILMMFTEYCYITSLHHVMLFVSWYTMGQGEQCAWWVVLWWQSWLADCQLCYVGTSYIMEVDTKRESVVDTGTALCETNSTFCFQCSSQHYFWSYRIIILGLVWS